MKFNTRSLTILAMISLLSVLTGCGGGGGGSDSGSGATGTLSLSLQDASSESYKAVYVTIDQVQVHLGGDETKGGKRRMLLSPKGSKTYNLLDLVNGVRRTRHC
jgi:hypothetical protein